MDIHEYLHVAVDGYSCPLADLHVHRCRHLDRSTAYIGTNDGSSAAAADWKELLSRKMVEDTPIDDGKGR